MKKKKRIFASAPSEQAQQTKKKVLSGKCLRTQHDKADRQTKLFKAADGIIAALKKRSALPVHANNPRAAFTLAEVLIALTVIGIVSALTIPTLVQKTNKQEYVSALQKAYSTLSQATHMIIAENGSPKADEAGETWMSDVDALYNMYKKYISSAKDCGSETGCFVHTQKDLAGVPVELMEGGRFRTMVFSDGMQLSIGNYFDKTCKRESGGSKNGCAYMFADVNGEKKPNVWGRDIFYFVLKENGLFPAGCDDTEDRVCAAGNYGAGCACKVLREGRMDY